MTKAEYRQLKAALHSEGAFEPSALWGTATIAAEIAIYVAGFVLLMAAPVLSLPWFGLQILLGWSMFRFYVIVHECGHKSLFKKRSTCTFVGTIASIFAGVPYIPWREVHNRHHKWVGVIDKDPTAKALLQLKSYSSAKNWFFRFVWHLWIPAMFFVFVFSLLWGWPFRQLRDGNKNDAMRGLLSVVIIAAPRIALPFIIGLEAALWTLLPMTYVFLFIDENVSLPQHTGLFPHLSKDHPRPVPPWEHTAITRTTHKPGMVAVAVSLNFNLHTEHHLFPTLPWYRLPRVTALLEQLDDYQQVNFARFMFDIRTQNPIDVYTRALPD